MCATKQRERERERGGWRVSRNLDRVTSSPRRNAIRHDSYATEMPDALSLREDKSFDGAREASRCSSRSRHGWATAVSSMKRDTMSAAGGSALSANRSAPNIGLFVFIRVPDVLTVIRVERSIWTVSEVCIT